MAMLGAGFTPMLRVALGLRLTNLFELLRTIVRETEGVPQGRPKAKALGYQRRIPGYPERPKAKALGYLEAKTLILRHI
jgi:hypothetical protein